METASAMPSNRDTGFHSAAGLIRYFDQEDEKALKIPPWFVVVLCIALVLGTANFDILSGATGAGKWILISIVWGVAVAGCVIA